MTMRRHEREATWEVPTENRFIAEVRIDMQGGVCTVRLPTEWQRFDTWNEGVAYVERTLGRKLLPETEMLPQYRPARGLVRRRESWVDGTDGHAARLQSGGAYNAEAWSGDFRASQDKIETWEAAITAGQRMLGALQALQREDAKPAAPKVQHR